MQEPPGILPARASESRSLAAQPSANSQATRNRVENLIHSNRKHRRSGRLTALIRRLFLLSIAHDDVILRVRPIARRISRAEEPNDRRAERRGKMQRSRVCSNEEFGAMK